MAAKIALALKKNGSGAKKMALVQGSGVANAVFDGSSPSRDKVWVTMGLAMM